MIAKFCETQKIHTWQTYKQIDSKKEIQCLVLLYRHPILKILNQKFLAYCYTWQYAELAKIRRHGYGQDL